MEGGGGINRGFIRRIFILKVENNALLTILTKERYVTSLGTYAYSRKR